jgi:DNA-binding IclR family transcriptional regulator
MSAFIIGRKLLTRMGVLQMSRPVMEDLCRRCNEAVYLAIRRGSEFLFIDLVESAQQVKITPLVGKDFPLLSAAPGKVMLAFAGEEVPASPQETGAINLPAIREKGFCHEHGGLGEMVGCLAAPLFNGLGSVAGAICVVGPTFRMPDLQVEASLWPLLRDASQAISSKLGYMQPYMSHIRL